MTRILITGGPRTGKTTLGLELSNKHGCPLNEGDSTMHLGWSESSFEISQWMDEPGSWVIEGVQVPRAIRKWLNRSVNRDDRARKPADTVILLTGRQKTWEARHAAMEKGVMKVWREVVPELRRRGVEIVEWAEQEGPAI